MVGAVREVDQLIEDVDQLVNDAEQLTSEYSPLNFEGLEKPRSAYYGSKSGTRAFMNDAYQGYIPLHATFWMNNLFTRDMELVFIDNLTPDSIIIILRNCKVVLNDVDGYPRSVRTYAEYLQTVLECYLENLWEKS